MAQNLYFLDNFDRYLEPILIDLPLKSLELIMLFRVIQMKSAQKKRGQTASAMLTAYICILIVMTLFSLVDSQPVLALMILSSLFFVLVIYSLWLLYDYYSHYEQA
jgi:hypothetical protein